jgi:CheY-like chemotaxis protein
MISKHTILYAEDDIDDVFMVKEAFEKHDHIEVVHAFNGWEALQILNGMHSNQVLPCLMILDINMPVMDGKEALAKVKSNPNLKSVPIVLFSTSNSISDQFFAQQWDVELITKPLNFNDLEGIAREFVNRCNFEINQVKQTT